MPAGVDDDRIQQQQQQLLKDHMFEKPTPEERVHAITLTQPDDGCHYAIDLALAFCDNLEMNVVKLMESMYSLGEETCCGSEELLTVALDGESESDGDGDGCREPGNWDDMIHREPVEGRDHLDASAVLDRIREVTSRDDTLQRIIRCKEEKKQRLPYDLIKGGLKLELCHCRYADGIVRVRDRVYVPSDEALRAQVVALHHETLPGGHSGRHGTYEKLMRHYYWPGMTSTVAQYVRNCLTCQRSKPHKEGKHGLLNPLPIPDTY